LTIEKQDAMLGSPQLSSDGKSFFERVVLLLLWAMPVAVDARHRRLRRFMSSGWWWEVERNKINQARL
jgi:Zn-dependent membrane protease YugP